MEQNEDNYFYLHCPECMGHWELVYDVCSQQWSLQCVNCGSEPDDNFVINGPILDDPECFCCGG